jgi:hypothetical protein
MSDAGFEKPDQILAQISLAAPLLHNPSVRPER